jgi:hypothetical protein
MDSKTERVHKGREDGTAEPKNQQKQVHVYTEISHMTRPDLWGKLAAAVNEAEIRHFSGTKG